MFPLAARSSVPPDRAPTGRTIVAVAGTAVAVGGTRVTVVEVGVGAAGGRVAVALGVGDTGAGGLAHAADTTANTIQGSHSRLISRRTSYAWPRAPSIPLPRDAKRRIREIDATPSRGRNTAAMIVGGRKNTA